jgi:hypothetical protein
MLRLRRYCGRRRGAPRCRCRQSARWTNAPNAPQTRALNDGQPVARYRRPDADPLQDHFPVEGWVAARQANPSLCRPKASALPAISAQPSRSSRGPQPRRSPGRHAARRPARYLARNPGILVSARQTLRTAVGPREADTHHPVRASGAVRTCTRLIPRGISRGRCLADRLPRGHSRFQAHPLPMATAETRACGRTGRRGRPATVSGWIWCR